jgi:hypothetical protein
VPIQYLDKHFNPVTKPAFLLCSYRVLFAVPLYYDCTKNVFRDIILHLLHFKWLNTFFTIGKLIL